MSNKIKHPAIMYFGGKWRLAEWIISHFPKHTHYIEVFGGAASVLIQKPRSKMETYNDLDGNVVNYFRMLRDKPDELLRLINLTPWAREEYNNHAQPTDEPLEKARRFWVGQNMAISNMAFGKSGMSMHMHPKHSVRFNSRFKKIHLVDVSNRFNNVQIENKDYQSLIETYDYTDNLFYVDPPYTHETRSSSQQYLHEFTEIDHEQLAAALKEVLAYVVLSGYDSSLYSKLYHDWIKYHKKSRVNGKGKKTETLWLSPKTYEALNNKQLKLF